MSKVPGQQPRVGLDLTHPCIPDSLGGPLAQKGVSESTRYNGHKVSSHGFVEMLYFPLLFGSSTLLQLPLLTSRVRCLPGHIGRGAVRGVRRP